MEMVSERHAKLGCQLGRKTPGCGVEAAPEGTNQVADLS